MTHQSDPKKNALLSLTVTCKVCKKSFAGVQRLAVHTKRDHPKDGLTPEQRRERAKERARAASHEQYLRKKGVAAVMPRPAESVVKHEVPSTKSTLSPAQLIAQALALFERADAKAHALAIEVLLERFG